MSELVTPAPDSPAAAAPSPAVAPPPGQPRFPLLDSVRAIAVLCVLIFHVASLTGGLDRPVIGDVLALLSNGVTFFFVISGFLLYRPYAAAHLTAAPQPSTARYLRRRALRILPAYWTALTVLAIFPGIAGVFSGDWWRYYLFGQIYSQRTLGGGIPPAWSLCVEVTFYLALPLWGRLIGRLVRDRTRLWLRIELTALALVAVAGVAVQVAASRLAVSQLVATTLLGECTWLALGMALAVLSAALTHGSVPQPLHRAVQALARRPLLCWVGAVACLAGAGAVLQPGNLANIVRSLHTSQPYGRTLGGIALIAGLSVLLLVPALFGEREAGLPRRVLAWAPLAWLGLISYGIYLYHLTVAELIAEPRDPGHFSASGLGLASALHHLRGPALFVLTLAGSTALAAVSYYVVELRFLRRKER